MISAASRAIWSWVSVTEAPWSMITTICFDCGLTAETYTGLPTHGDKDLQSHYLQDARTLQNDFAWTLDGMKPSAVLAWFPLSSLQCLCKRSCTLLCCFWKPFSTPTLTVQISSTAFTTNAILPKSCIHPISGWKPVRMRVSCAISSRRREAVGTEAEMSTSFSTGTQCPQHWVVDSSGV